LAQSSAILLGALIAATSLVFTLIRVWINECTTRATEEGLITDRINAAVASLGADKTVKGFEDGKEYTRPNIEVRVGAILALERIVKRSPDVHCQIMEILCSYIRENTKRIEDDPIDRMAIFAKNYAISIKPWETRPDLHVYQYNQANHELPASPKSLRDDIQLALTVIGRRSEARIAQEPPRLIDLRNTNLVKADLQGARLPNARLSNSNLQGANLKGAVLGGSDLENANLQQTSLTCVDLTNANMSRANLQNSEFLLTIFDEANLSGAVLQETKLNFSTLKKTSLNTTEFQRAKFRAVWLSDVKHLDDALLDSTCIQNSEIEGIEITSNQLKQMFGDASVKLTKKTAKPEFWPDKILEDDDFKNEYKKWLFDPDGYVFDQTQYGEKYTNQTGA